MSISISRMTTALFVSFTFAAGCLLAAYADEPESVNVSESENAATGEDPSASEDVSHTASAASGDEASFVEKLDEILIGKNNAINSENVIWAGPIKPMGETADATANAWKLLQNQPGNNADAVWVGGTNPSAAWQFWAAAANGKRSWGPKQATGAPNTPEAGDRQTSWASRTQDEQAEWLELTFASPVDARVALIYESFNPGAVSRVTIVDKPGKERTLWSTKPGDVAQESRVLAAPLGRPGSVKTLRIYLDSPAVKGWNEIDAVGLIDSRGKVHWAAQATASSTYADINAESTKALVDWQPRQGARIWWTHNAYEQRIQSLEQQVQRLRQEMDQLRGTVKSDGGMDNSTNWTPEFNPLNTEE